MAATTSSTFDHVASAAQAKVDHPLSPLTTQEIAATADILKAAWPNVDLQFKVLTLEEAPKREVRGFLDAEHGGGRLPSIARKALVSYYIRNTVSHSFYHTKALDADCMEQNRFHEAIVNLSTSEIESNVRLGPNEHGNVDFAEFVQVEKAALNDERVRAEIAKLSIPEDAVVCADPWIYGKCCVSIIYGQGL